MYRIPIPAQAEQALAPYWSRCVQRIGTKAQWVCTCRKGHDGPHIAHHEDGRPIEAWCEWDVDLLMDEGL